MSKEELKELVELIQKAVNKIGNPPKGRELAIMKTHLETAEVWSTKVKTID